MDLGSLSCVLAVKAMVTGMCGQYIGFAQINGSFEVQSLVRNRLGCMDLYCTGDYIRKGMTWFGNRSNYHNS